MSRFWFRRSHGYRFRFRLFWGVVLLGIWLLCSGDAYAETLSNRLTRFPDWHNKPSVQAPKGDLAYPDWMAGNWTMTTTLTDLVAPLAPNIQTPGFDGNRSLLGQPVTCEVRFEPKLSSLTKSFLLKPRLAQETIVANREFNGLSLARAYLGQEAVKSVKVDVSEPNHQITTLQRGSKLESTTVGRAVEVPSENNFVTVEISQQVFRDPIHLYINEVETLTDYRFDPENFMVQADQATAIYLSPKDPEYFKAPNQPIALYRYKLALTPV